MPSAGRRPARPSSPESVVKSASRTRPAVGRRRSAAASGPRRCRPGTCRGSCPEFTRTSYVNDSRARHSAKSPRATRTLRSSAKSWSCSSGVSIDRPNPPCDQVRGGRLHDVAAAVGDGRPACRARRAGSGCARRTPAPPGAARCSSPTGRVDHEPLADLAHGQLAGRLNASRTSASYRAKVSPCRPTTVVEVGRGGAAGPA